MSRAITPPAWTDDALCAQVDPELFFPEIGVRTAAQALQVCAECPVLNQCRRYALTLPPSVEGVWGGMTHRQRKRARYEGAGRKAPAKCGTRAGYLAHLRVGNPTCDECRAAQNAYQRANFAARKARGAA